MLERLQATEADLEQMKLLQANEASEIFVVAGARTVNFLRRVSLAKDGPTTRWAAAAA